MVFEVSGCGWSCVCGGGCIGFVCITVLGMRMYIHSMKPPKSQLLDMALSAASGREALMMLQGALSSKPMPGMLYAPHACPYSYHTTKV